MNVPNVETVYEDDDLRVVIKPAHLATTAPNDGDCLTQRCEAQFKEKLHPTSRLDAEVTGMVTFARTKRGIHHLKRAREEGRYGRGYLALTLHAPSEPQMRWTRAIGIHPRDPRLRIALPENAKGERVQTAKSDCHTIAVSGGVAVLWLTPHTGRTHQLRVHAADAGFPLWGDVRYGAQKRLVLGNGRVVTARRTMLHCAWLRLPQKKWNEDLVLQLPVPQDFQKAWQAVGGELCALSPTPSTV